MFSMKKNREWKVWTKLGALFAFILFFTLGCANLFSEMSDKTTDKALLYSAKLKMDKGDWSGAIADILATSADFQANRDVKAELASAYAGRCGLDLISMANAIQNAGASSFMSVLLAAIKAPTVSNLNDCIAAEATLKTIGSETVRNANENLLMAFLSLAKMSVILNIYADANANGVIDAGFLPCNAAPATGLAAFPKDNSATNRADAYEMTTGLGLFLTSLTAAGMSGAAGSMYSSIDTACTTLAGLVGTNPCQVVDRASVSAAMARAIRAAIIDNGGIGLAINDGGTCALSTCFTVNCAAY